MSSNFPAPFPKSPIAGVTNPRMMSGMANDRKLPNKELNVTKIRAIPSGRNWPNTTPATIAITTLANREIFILFMMLLYFIAGSGYENTH